jgi:hypothetical protein
MVKANCKAFVRRTMHRSGDIVAGPAAQSGDMRRTAIGATPQRCSGWSGKVNRKTAPLGKLALSDDVRGAIQTSNGGSKVPAQTAQLGREKGLEEILLNVRRQPRIGNRSAA